MQLSTIYHRLSITQKILIAPVSAVIIFSAFLIFSYIEHDSTQKYLSDIQQAHYPVLELSSQNITLFEQFNKALQDAVRANESHWIEEAVKKYQVMLQNISRLNQKYARFIPSQKLEAIKTMLIDFKNTSVGLSHAMITQGGAVTEEMIEKMGQMNRLREDVSQRLQSFKVHQQSRFDNALSESTHKLNKINFIGIFLGLLAIIFIIVLTSSLALPTRKTLKELRSSFESINRGEADFSHTLTTNSQDEIGAFVDAFNRFTRKLEKDHNELQQIKANLEIQKAKAESATEAKSKFLANMSHEIRTPMNSILGFVSLLQHTTMSTKEKHYLDVISYSGNALLTIINDILDFSKIEAGKLHIEMEDFDLYQTIDSVATLLRIGSQEKGLGFHIDIAPEIDQYLYGDPLRINQVLTNLLGNAIKFTHQGDVGLKVTQLPTGVLSFDVWDTGIGLTQEQIKKLFTSFTQADDTTTREYGGTGLGLAISKQLIELMKGTIRVESRPGSGSHFIFELPLKSASGKPRFTPQSHIKKDLRNRVTTLNGSRILLADDYEMNIEMVHALLEHTDILIDDADCGERAIELFRQNPDAYDLVLMDIQMPVINGYDAAAEIRKHNRSVPIIALTANIQKEIRLKASEFGMNRCLVKPINVDEFYSALLEFIPSKQPMQFVVNTNGESNLDLDKFHFLDTRQALSHINGNKRLYEKLLRDFLDTYSTKEHRSLKLSAQSDETLRFLHTLKSSSAAIGALQVSEAAHRLEETFNEENRQLLLTHFTDLLNQLQLSLPASEEKKSIYSKTERTPKELERLFDELYKALKKQAPQEIKSLLFQLNQSHLNKREQEIFDQLDKLIRRYKFKDAIIVIQEYLDA